MMKPQYQEVWFRCHLRPDELPAVFGVVTACNPNGPPLDGTENERRTAELRRHLQGRRLVFFPVSGGSRDGNHQEPGFGIAGLSVEELRELGNELGQDAVFYIAEGDVVLVSCTDDTSVRIATWKERWIPAPGSSHA